MNKLLKNFYKKSIEERIEALESIERFDANLNQRASDVVLTI